MQSFILLELQGTTRPSFLLSHFAFVSCFVQMAYYAQYLLVTMFVILVIFQSG